MKGPILSLALLLCLSAPVRAEEEALDLDSAAPVVAPVPAAHPHSASNSGFKLMGRVDLTYEVSPFINSGNLHKNDAFENDHFLVFLKVQASPQVSFMGEIVNKTFYSIDYQPTDWIKLRFGKIAVPFGDSSKFHHFYGGVQGLNATGVMFPNIWAEYGIDAEWRIGSVTLDTYVVNGIGSTSAAIDPAFNGASDPATQALGARASTRPFSKLTTIASVYYSQWQPGRPLYIIGLDAITDYGLVDTPVLRSLRLAAGLANGEIKKGSLGDYRKYGDFIELRTNAFRFAEPRIRYGTYIHNSKDRGARDTQGLSLGANVPINAMNLLAEYQWNFEGANERSNDLVRLMLSLDF